MVMMCYNRFTFETWVSPQEALRLLRKRNITPIRGLTIVKDIDEYVLEGVFKHG
jgi:hypothetical protein